MTKRFCDVCGGEEDYGCESDTLYERATKPIDDRQREVFEFKVVMLSPAYHLCRKCIAETLSKPRY